ncbi:hypothetical protein M231_04411 [Tremella mesenterica]|uniref:Nickel/cobalt efflux system n=1 Tax=Tremella mesenterica TaxID=5217 RepID=A0A4Q1BKT4_TREME|nr:hypothetical protein M231_04411 [Tremella mesenterica]
MTEVGSVGGIVGTSVSASFLFLIAVLNSYFLHSALRDRRRLKRAQRSGLPIEELSYQEDSRRIQGGGCMVRIIAPILKAVDREWKMYPVGILFGFAGFDTASSIALLAISAIAQRGPHGEQISHGKIVLFPFTAGMSLVDSLDSVLMLYAYAAPSRQHPDGKLTLFHPRLPISASLPTAREDENAAVSEELLPSPRNEEAPLKVETGRGGTVLEEEADTKSNDIVEVGEMAHEDERMEGKVLRKTTTMSTLSIILTLLSIVVALSISIIEILGLIGDNCSSCSAAAQDPNSGLRGNWWRFWAKTNDESGYIGAGIVGSFVVIVGGWYGGRWAWRRRNRSRRVE